MIDQTDIHSALMEMVQNLYMTPEPVVIYAGFPAPQSGYWMRVTHLPNVPDRSSLDGTTPLDHRGILQLDLMCEPGQHEIVYIARAQGVIDQFPQTGRTTSSTATVKVVKAYSLGGRATGDHWMVPVRIEYVVEAA